MLRIRSRFPTADFPQRVRRLKSAPSKIHCKIRTIFLHGFYSVDPLGVTRIRFNTFERSLKESSKVKLLRGAVARVPLISCYHQGNREENAQKSLKGGRPQYVIT